nr:MAG TPA: hypothetical protein [Caudoviricetes sp.]
MNRIIFINYTMTKQFVSTGNVQAKKKLFLCAMTITNI